MKGEGRSYAGVRGVWREREWGVESRESSHCTAPQGPTGTHEVPEAEREWVQVCLSAVAFPRTPPTPQWEVGQGVPAAKRS